MNIKNGQELYIVMKADLNGLISTIEIHNNKITAIMEIGESVIGGSIKSVGYIGNFVETPVKESDKNE